MERKTKKNIEVNNTTPETFTNEELKKIIDLLDYEDKMRYIVMFALITGIRKSEMLALKEKDIQNDIIKINKTIRIVYTLDDKDNQKYEIKEYKHMSKALDREVPVPDILKPELKRLTKLNSKEKLNFGEAYNKYELLFPSSTGDYINPNYLTKKWKRLLADANVKYKRFNALRNTYAVSLLKNGTPILVVSKILGHKSIKSTKIYTNDNKYIIKNV